MTEWQRMKRLTCPWRSHGKLVGAATLRFHKRARSRRDRRRTRQVLAVDHERVETKQRPSGDDAWRIGPS